MMSETNRHGLSRYIPAEVRLAVRQACGFGCVVCGMSIVEYEHIDPEFPDAKSHEASGIALLCSTCHGNVTRKFWSKAKIAEARCKPQCKEIGFSWGALDIGAHHPVIRFAGVTFRRCAIPVEVRGTPLFQIEQPEAPGTPFRLSATFASAEGEPLFEIRQNEWTARAGVWDTEFVGGRITIRDKKDSQRLILRTEPPHGIAVEQLDMQVRGHRFIGDTDTLRVVFPGGGFGEFTNCGMDGCRVGISL